MMPGRGTSTDARSVAKPVKRRPSPAPLGTSTDVHSVAKPVKRRPSPAPLGTSTDARSVAKPVGENDGLPYTRHPDLSIHHACVFRTAARYHRPLMKPRAALRCCSCLACPIALPAAVTGLMLIHLVSGCEENEPTPASSGVRAATTAPAAANWRTIDGSSQIAVPQDSAPADLERAIGEARSTMGDARLRWQQASEEQRRHWAVKWKATTADGGLEFLWVRPLSWSPFRVEGELANPPQRPLTRGAGLGDVVSFPIEDAVDWVHFTEGDPNGRREGGFTMDLFDAGEGIGGDR